MSAPGNHPLGPDRGAPDTRCGSCAWSYLGGPGPKVMRCRAAGRRPHFPPRVDPSWVGCAHWEPPPQCLGCAACCDAAFDVVELAPSDPARALHPELFARLDGRWVLSRNADGRCPALQADNRCRIYEDRPRTCRWFEKDSDNCLWARRRLGLSPRWEAPVVGSTEQTVMGAGPENPT